MCMCVCVYVCGGSFSWWVVALAMIMLRERVTPARQTVRACMPSVLCRIPPETQFIRAFTNLCCGMQGTGIEAGSFPGSHDPFHVHVEMGVTTVVKKGEGWRCLR